MNTDTTSSQDTRVQVQVLAPGGIVIEATGNRRIGSRHAAGTYALLFADVALELEKRGVVRPMHDDKRHTPTGVIR